MNSHTILWWLAQNTITIALLALVIWLLSGLLKHRPALLHALWVVLLLKFITPPVIVWPWSAQDVSQQLGLESFFPSPPATTTEADLPVDAAHAWSDAQLAATTSSPSDFQFVHGTQSSPPTEHVATLPKMEHPTLPTLSLPRILFALWLGAGLAAALVQLRRLWNFRRIVVDSQPAPPAFEKQVFSVARRMRTRALPTRLAGQVTTPFVWCFGWLRLIWPQALSGESEVRRLRGVIAHELAHVKRRDHWVAWLEMLAACLWWWNPLFWWVRRQIRDTADLACDARALSILPAAQRRAYAEAFLELSGLVSKEQTPAPALGVSTGACRTVKRRLSMILNERVKGTSSMVGLLLAGALAIVVLPVWSLGQDTDPAPSDVEAVEGVIVEHPIDIDEDGWMDVFLAITQQEDIDADGEQDIVVKQLQDNALREFRRMAEIMAQKAAASDRLQARVLQLENELRDAKMRLLQAQDEKKYLEEVAAERARAQAVICEQAFGAEWAAKLRAEKQAVSAKQKVLEAAESFLEQQAASDDARSQASIFDEVFAPKWAILRAQQAAAAEQQAKQAARQAAVAQQATAAQQQAEQAAQLAQQAATSEMKLEQMTAERELLRAQLKALENQLIEAQSRKAAAENEALANEAKAVAQQEALAKERAAAAEQQADRAVREELAARYLLESAQQKLAAAGKLDLVQLAAALADATEREETLRCEYQRATSIRESSLIAQAEFDRIVNEHRAAIRKLDVMRRLAETALKAAEDELAQTEKLFQRGYVSELQLQAARRQCESLRIILSEASPAKEEQKQ